MDRLFPNLPALEASEKHWIAAEKLGAFRGNMHEHEYEALENQSQLELGHSIFGQALVHGLTGNSTTHLDRVVEDSIFLNTPEVDLDWLYGAGPLVSPYMYTSIDTHRCLLAINNTTLKDGTPTEDFYRVGSTAIIGDPRNAENAWVTQLHLTFMRFHNWVVNNLFSDVQPNERFEEARNFVISSYHRLIVDWYLPNLVQADVLADVLDGNYKYFDSSIETVPVEFNHFMRYGHSQIPSGVAVNPELDTIPFFHNGSFNKPEKPVKLEWFFDLKENQAHQKCRLIDTELSRMLTKLPNGMSLSTLNIHTSMRHAMPSFQTIEKQLASDGFNTIGLELDQNCIDAGFDETPLWYGALQESKEATGGVLLGPVASRVVSEVLIGLCERYSTDYKYMPRRSFKAWYDWWN